MSMLLASSRLQALVALSGRRHYPTDSRWTLLRRSPGRSRTPVQHARVVQLPPSFFPVALPRARAEPWRHRFRFIDLPCFSRFEELPSEMTWYEMSLVCF